MLLSCRQIQKSFGAVPVLRDGWFQLEEKEKAAVVGINGAGKTTLLRILTGETPADSGSVTLAKGIRPGVLSQHQGLAEDCGIYEEAAKAKAGLFRMEEELATLEKEIAAAASAAPDALLERYSRLRHEFELQGGYAARSEITGVLKGLGFSEDRFLQRCGSLSGGEKTRVALSKLLLTRPELILLDEPTNHLDIGSVVWLEGFLRDYPGAVIVVSHDRYFLDRFVTKVIEVENGSVTMYSGNYSVYAEKKRQAREVQLHHYLDQQKEIRRQEESIARLKSFNREKSIKRAESKEKALGKLQRLERPQEVRDAMRFSLDPHVISGERVLAVRGLSKRFGSKQLFEDLSFEIRRGERCALIGDNGTGKTSLLRIVNGLLSPESGEIVTGAKVAIGYYDQEQQLLTESNTLFEELREAYPSLTDTQVRGTLAAFLFTGDDVFKTVSVLSGGERARLSLAKLILSPCNFLILDEPTNHLDMTSREILEQALSSYTGTVFYVSHDRYFINRTATRILELEHGALTSYEGDYDDYLEDKARRTDLASAPQKIREAAVSTSEQRRRAAKEEQAEKSRLRTRIRRLEEELEKKEAESALVDREMADPDVAGDYTRLLPLTQRSEALKQEIAALFAEWESLQE